ncbi:MAG TPA: 50S ribosomal protein L15 [Alphaproteobacteria bacterium]|nr:50S ribosomal protein L15 [Alphaproteobacteria bacterium]
MQLNDLRDNPGARKKKMCVGRGIGCGKGKTSGRGVKGQKARSGKTGIRQFEGGQMPLHRRLPKRGFNNIFALEHSEINLGRLQAAIDSGKVDAKQPINYETLSKAGVVAKAKDGLRLLGTGEIKAKIELTVAGASKSAIAAVEKAGGKVTVYVKPKPVPKPNSKKKTAA